jgi:predicted small lipoprotein YifL
MKKLIKITAILMCLFILAACGEPEPIESPPMDPGSDPLVVSDTSGYEQITYLVCIGDPAAYMVYVITPDRITTYDFTKYWMNATDGYHYFDDEMPDEDEYSSEWIDLSPEGWDKLVNSLVYNKFEKLPEDMSVDGICDGATYYIEVKTEDGTCLSGGYGAGQESGKKQERFYNVVAVINEVIRDAEEEAEEKWALFTEPQEPVYLNEPATADVFAAFDDHYEFSDLEYYFGPYDEVDEDSVPIRYGWELTDGGIAWVSFGAQSRVSDIELWYDDHFEILMSSLKCLETGFDVKYHDIDPGSLSEYDAKFFDLITMMIQNEIDAVSEDHLYSNNDYEVVAHFGEKLDRDEPEVLGEYAMWSSYRMPASDLAAFYEEVFHEEREFEPDFDRNFDINDLPEQGILCMDDGYCYTCAGAMYEQHAELVSVAESDGVYIVNSRMISDLNGEVMGYVRYVLKTTDGTYGYELLDHMYSHVMY